MDARNDEIETVNLSSLPNEMISNEICLQLDLESILSFRHTNKRHHILVDRFFQLTMPNLPLKLLLNCHINHFTHLYTLFKLQPNLIAPLTNPDTLLTLCSKLTPLGMQRLSILFPLFDKELYQPIKTIAHADDDDRWLPAYVCYALLTTDIKTIDLGVLDQVHIGLRMDATHLKINVTEINKCLAAIKSVRRTQTYVSQNNLPDTPCYVNLQGASLRHAKFRDVNLLYANLQNADLSFTELQQRSLFGMYLKNAKANECYLWDTQFFDLKSYIPLTQQLNMWHFQITPSDQTIKLIEAMIKDLTKQLSSFPDAPNKLNMLEIITQHPLFKNEQNHLDIQIALNKLGGSAMHSGSFSRFFPLPRRSAYSLNFLPAATPTTRPK